MKAPTSLAISAVFLLMGCAPPAAPRLAEPERSEYFTTMDEQIIPKGAGFQYAIRVQINKPLNGGHPWFAVIDYENPANPSAHLTQAGVVDPKGDHLVFLSPVVSKLSNHKTYSVTMKVYSDQAMTHLIAVHPMAVRLDFLDPRTSMGLMLSASRPLGHEEIH